MDFDGRCIALLAGYDLDDESVSVTEARVLRPGGGRAKLITGEAASQEPRAVGGVALAGDRLITTLTGANRTNVLTRHDLRTGRSIDARAFADLNAAGDGFDFTSSKVPAGRYTTDLVAPKPAGREGESAEVAVP